MNLKDFIGGYKNHPVLFVGAGLSLRYLNSSYTWDGLLSYIAEKIKGSHEYYLDLKALCEKDGVYDFAKIASLLEGDFIECLKNDRDGEFKFVNDIFYKEMEKNNNISRFKIYISHLLSNGIYREDMVHEIL